MGMGHLYARLARRRIWVCLDMIQSQSESIEIPCALNVMIGRVGSMIVRMQPRYEFFAAAWTVNLRPPTLGSPRALRRKVIFLFLLKMS